MEILTRNDLTKRRRSTRLHLKRPRETGGECVVPEIENCPVCGKELDQEDNENNEGLVCCSKCGRRFHLICSGLKSGWAGYYKLRCEHHGLECNHYRAKSHTETINKNDAKEPSTGLGLPRKSAAQSILRWVVNAGGDDLKRKRFRQIGQDDAGHDEGKTMKQNNSSSGSIKHNIKSVIVTENKIMQSSQVRIAASGLFVNREIAKQEESEDYLRMGEKTQIEIIQSTPGPVNSQDTKIDGCSEDVKSRAQTCSQVGDF